MEFFIRDSVVGEVRAWLGAGVPPNANWLVLDGSVFSQASYPALYALLGTATLPDARGAALSGVAGGETVGSVVGANVKQVPLPAHTHGLRAFNASSYNGGDAPTATYGVGAVSGQTESAGGSADFDVRGRRLLVNYIIRGR